MVFLLPLLDPPTPEYNLQPTPSHPIIMPTQWHNTQRDFSANIWHKLEPFSSVESDSVPDDCEVTEWNWEIEQEDRKREQENDNSRDHLADVPLIVDRTLLRSLVGSTLSRKVTRITFLSSGTFHKAYLVKLHPTNENPLNEVIARVARRFMPKLKTESEIATMAFLQERVGIPVPEVLHYDSNPWNRVGGEFIIMTKAPGIPLSQVYHTLPRASLVKLMNNLAIIILKVWERRFDKLGSIYLNTASPTTVDATHGPSTSSPGPSTISAQVKDRFTIGPMISWPFFGSNRGFLGDADLDRGPYDSFKAYLDSCKEREINGVIAESEGKSAPHRIHLDPAEIYASIQAIPSGEGDDSDEYEWEDEGPGYSMYRDYRRNQRTTFLISELRQREECVRGDMDSFLHLMMKLSQSLQHNANVDADKQEEFGLDCHDLSLDNVFVDEEECWKVTCIIDWESTTTRPLWACAHLPAFLQAESPLANLFLETVGAISHSSATEWLQYEKLGTKLRIAHRFIEWDGWEEGLKESILGDTPSLDDEVENGESRTNM